jgi:ArsR family transcriptional regulator
LPDHRSSELDWLAAIAQLGEMARVRMLDLLEQEELGVGELARIVQLPQSTVSRHLKALSLHGWIVKRSEGTASLYRVLSAALDADQERLWRMTRARLADDPVFADDRTRLREVVAGREIDSRAFFGRIGGEWHDLREALFGRGFDAAALLGMLNPTWTVADLGCGTGEVSERLAPMVGTVIAVDREPAMLAACQARLEAFGNVELREADLSALPIDSDSLDAAVLMLVLHHVESPLEVVAEAMRALRRGGILLLVDMVAHTREAYRHEMGHLHLGFSEATIQSWAAALKCEVVRINRLSPDPLGKGPGLFAATFLKA